MVSLARIYCFGVCGKMGLILILQRDNLEHVMVRDHLSLQENPLPKNVTYPPYPVAYPAIGAVVCALGG